MPHASSAGMGIQAVGKVPHASDAGRGIQAVGQVPHASDAGRGKLLTSCGRTAWEWLHKLANRLERVRVVHGDWSRCLNNHFGGKDTAVFLDPPYRAFEKLYGATVPVADAVDWSRGRLTYGGGKTTNEECIWYSPACLPRETRDLFAEVAA